MTRFLRKKNHLWCCGDPGSHVVYGPDASPVGSGSQKKGPSNQANSIDTDPPTGARHSLTLCSSHWQMLRIFCNSTSHLNWEHLAHAISLSSSCQGWAVAEGTEGNSWEVGLPIFPSFWKVRLKVLRNPFSPPPRAFWPSTFSAGNRKCLCQG